MRTLWQDLRYATRTLKANPAFVLIAVLSLALGIGANVGIFSIVNGLLLRPPGGVSAPERLVTLYTSDYSGPLYGSSSYPDYLEFRNQAKAFDNLAAHTIRPMSLSEGGESERVLGSIVTGNYFDMLGVRASLGRTFTLAEDETPGAPPVALISRSLWQRRFNSDPSIIGRSVVLSNQPMTVIGVTPANFTGTIIGISPDVFVPVNMHAEMPNSPELNNRGARSWLTLGRLKPGVSIEGAQAELNTVAVNLRAAYPEQWSNVRGEARRVTVLSERDARVPPQISSIAFGVAGLLMTVVALVLLIACANVANLLLARASVRRREIAIRIALGASRRRIIRQLLTESVLLALVSGIAGLLVALWTIDLLTAFKPPSPVPLALDFAPDFRVLMFALGLSILTGLIFGLAPALQATRADVVPALKDESLAAGQVYRWFGLRNLLVIAQVALSLVLLVGAGLFLRSLQNAQTIDPGFRTDNILVMTPEVEIHGYDEAKSREFYRQLLERTEGLPGVQSATLSEVVPLGFQSQRSGIYIEGYERQAGEDREVDTTTVGTRYFETLDISLLLGRDFTGQDRDGAPRVGIVNETFARRYYGANANPIGKRISVSGAEGPFIEIVGVVRDSKYNTLGESSLPYFYLPHLQNFSNEMTLFVRTVGEPQASLAAVRNEIRLLDKNLPVSNAQTLNEYMSGALLLPRVGAWMLGILGALALLLVAVGLFGVMSFTVARRTREIGIRIALGAQQVDVIKLVLIEGLLLVGGGVALGLVVAVLLTRVLVSLLYGVSPVDFITFAGVVVMLFVVAALAGYVPARRATKVDPMVALRYE
ncbi:MAG: ABC transporter permease [Pyrinomonadaceae bacterium MAG19_C2-C3]|nr:ABC transporter permease [Pyrinomonadaceae bacterium MAG19_C2-C3]